MMASWRKALPLNQGPAASGQAARRRESPGLEADRRQHPCGPRSDGASRRRAVERIDGLLWSRRRWLSRDPGKLSAERVSEQEK